MASTTVGSHPCSSSWPPLLLLLLLPWLWCLFFLCPMVSSSTHNVTQLPGFDGPLPFSLETGYVEVDEANGVHLFYYFVQSEKEPARDPLLLWLQGGPGCSGLSGLVYEIGPFLFNIQYIANGYADTLPRLVYRPETWSKVSNIIFVDSPVGAGFSYATTKDGFNSSDTIAIKQLVIFLNKWMDEHPQFMSNPLYIGGESYSGIMIPALTLEIDRVIRKGAGETKPFNLKGYIAGNPMTDKQFDTDGKYKFFHGMGLISDELYERAKESCGGTYYQPSNHQCAAYIEEIDHCVKDINEFHILEPSCEVLWRQMTEQDEMRRLMLESTSGNNLPLLPFKCRHDSYELLFIWENDEAVKNALGIRQDTVGEWRRCHPSIPYINDIPSTVEHHLRLHKLGYKSMIYSGDHDSGFSMVGTQAWIRSLNLSISDDWRPWYVGGQVAGFTRTYSDNLTYATVKGAGHTAPEYKPKECLEMFARWVSGASL